MRTSIAFQIRNNPMRRDLRSESGSALVETALAFTVLMALVFGILEASFMLYTYHTISNGARIGARYALVRGSTAGKATCSDPTPNSGPAQAGCAANTTDVQDYVREIPGLSNVNVTTTWMAAPDGEACVLTCASGDDSCNLCTSAGNVVQVKVSYPYTLSIPFVPQNTFTLTSTSQMVISQ